MHVSRPFVLPGCIPVGAELNEHILAPGLAATLSHWSLSDSIYRSDSEFVAAPLLRKNRVNLRKTNTTKHKKHK